MIKERSLVGGAVVAAFLASLCCIGPLLFVLLGVSAFGAATYFEKARPVLMGGSVLLLAVAFYWVYFRRREAECAPGDACATKTVSRANRIGLWVASVAVLAFAALPYFAGPLAAKIGEKKPASEQAAKTDKEDCCVARTPGSTAAEQLKPVAGMEAATFKVEGMTCVSCETTIKLALERVPGVSRAEVSYDRGEAVVEYDPHKTTPAALRDAINSTGYTVKEGN
jgi:mercuric ion transport protein